MNALRTKSVRQFIALLLIGCVAMMWAATASAAPPRFFPNMKSATWTAHISNDAGEQGELWLKKTPCGLGSFVQLKAPSLAGQATQERLILRREGMDDVELALIPADLPDFGIVIAYWPTGTSMFPDDPSELFVQLTPNAAFGSALPYPYTSSDPAWMTPDEYYAALDSGDVVVEVIADGSVVLSGRIAH